MKVLLLAGEESGRIYAGRLKSLLAHHEVRGYEDYGFETSDLAVMGFWPVMRRLFFFLGVKRTMQRAIDEWRPDVVCTIDYPGMNLKLAAYAKARGIRAVHVVCPQVWAWKSGRIPKIEASLDALCCFFPFEPALFRAGLATFVGHPLAEELRGAGLGAAREEGLVALLPGSRLGEIERCLPPMLDALALLPDGVRAVVPAANEGAKLAIDRIVAARGDALPVATRLGGAREVLALAQCAVVASGTATLEAALLRCPTVLVYRVSAALAWFARRVIKGVRHVGLVNVVWEKDGGTGEAPMPELLQEDFTPRRVADILRKWLSDAAARDAAVARLDAVVRELETDGSAFSRIVRIVAGGPGA
jgi:lipid-A-disaccharide synthase